MRDRDRDGGHPRYFRVLESFIYFFIVGVFDSVIRDSPLHGLLRICDSTVLPLCRLVSSGFVQFQMKTDSQKKPGW